MVYKGPFPPQEGYQGPSTLSEQSRGPVCVRVVVANMILSLPARCRYLYRLVLSSPRPAQ